MREPGTEDCAIEVHATKDGVYLKLRRFLPDVDEVFSGVVISPKVAYTLAQNITVAAINVEEGKTP